LDVRPWVVDLTPFVTMTPVTSNSIAVEKLNNTQFVGGLPLNFPPLEFLDQLGLPAEEVRLVDITIDLGYKGLYNGQDYTPVPRSNPDPNGFNAIIRHSSFLSVSTLPLATGDP